MAADLHNVGGAELGRIARRRVLYNRVMRAEASEIRTLQDGNWCQGSNDGYRDGRCLTQDYKRNLNDGCRVVVSLNTWTVKTNDTHSHA